MFTRATVALRPETPEDRPFLHDLYLSTRDDEPGFRDLDPGERTALLSRQFAWQHKQYLAAYPGGWFTIVTVDDRPAGRLYVAEQSDALVVIDLSLLPEFRGHGIGTQLLKSVQAEAARKQLPVRLRVASDNPARRFYARLGFLPVATEACRLLLEWRPSPPPGGA